MPNLPTNELKWSLISTWFCYGYFHQRTKQNDCQRSSSKSLAYYMCAYRLYTPYVMADSMAALAELLFVQVPYSFTSR